MPSLPDSSNDSSNASTGYLSYPVKYAVNSAIRRFSTDPFSSSRSPRPHSGDPISSASSYSNLAALDASNRTPPVSKTPEPSRAPVVPFQPPPLTPLTLSGAGPDTAQILSTQLAEEIRLLVPARLQLVDSWRLIFSLEQNGSSLSTLYDKCAALDGRRGGFVIVARDATGGIFGAYLTDAPRPSGGHYYGHGECFLWRCSTLESIPTLASLPLPPSADTTHAQRMTTIGSPTSPRAGGKRQSWDRSSQKSVNLIDFGDDDKDDDEFGSFKGSEDDEFGDFEGPTTTTTTTMTQAGQSHAGPERNGGVHRRSADARRHSGMGTSTPERIRFKAFPYSGENDYLIFCEHGFLSVGGGDGHYGLWLDGSLEKGISERCPTFGNEQLSDEGGKFDVIGVEVWYLGA